jgi:hypothetical protein
MASSKATEKEVKTVLDAVARGDGVPGGFCFNPYYEHEQVWRTSGDVGPEDLVPPSYRKAGAAITGDGAPGGHVVGDETLTAADSPPRSSKP